MQKLLREELHEEGRSPIKIHETGHPIEGGYLRGFLDRVVEKIIGSSHVIIEGQFHRIAELVLNSKRELVALGYPISDIIGQHLTFQHKQARSGVVDLSRATEFWPDYLIRLNSRDVVFLVKFRHYESHICQLAEISATYKVAVVLLTDEWMSPVKIQSTEILAVPIETGTIWSSCVTSIAIVETIVSYLVENTWNITCNRIKKWNLMREQTTESTS